MKKQVLFFAFLFLSVAGFSQLTKTEVTGFIERNPWSTCRSIIIAEGANVVEEIPIAKAVSVTPMETGLSVVITYDEGKRERLIAYRSINHLTINQFRMFVIDLKQ